MGKNASTVELLVKVWEGIREFLEVLNENTGSFFKHMRVFEIQGKTASDVSVCSGHTGTNG